VTGMIRENGKTEALKIEMSSHMSKQLECKCFALFLLGILTASSRPTSPAAV